MFTLCLLVIKRRKRGRNYTPQGIEKYKKNWSGRQDLNLRPLDPQSSALPDCATPRRSQSVHFSVTCEKFILPSFADQLRNPPYPQRNPRPIRLPTFAAAIPSRLVFGQQLHRLYCANEIRLARCSR